MDNRIEEAKYKDSKEKSEYDMGSIRRLTDELLSTNTLIHDVLRPLHSEAVEIVSHVDEKVRRTHL